MLIPTFFLYALLAWSLATTARMSGGGLGAEQLGRVGLGMVPEILFGMILGTCTSLIWQTVLLHAFDIVLPGWGVALMWFGLSLWFYTTMEKGHGVVLLWGDPAADQTMYDNTVNRVQGLTPLVNFVAKIFGIPYNGADGLRSRNYCRLFMAVKGFLLFLPLGGLPGAVLWSGCYEIAWRLRKPVIEGKWKFEAHGTGEILTGLAATVQIIIVWELVKWLLN